MSRMTAAITQLGDLVNEWVDNDHVPEVDWTRIRSIDFQELLNRRNIALKRLEGLGCVLCETFEPHVCPATLFNFIRVIYVHLVQNLTYRASPARQHCKSQADDVGSKSCAGP